ncbi:glycosyltransferase family 4 protein [Cryobacterium tagatosivorans]|uniref:Glycosyltransferase n=1 Tax=Cryobacterium tagatosivorans TaxID=1259199 RepID=A0A4R8UEH3_9MICO|nr:glycosyltransferase family 4 protein [Cryobacterium tagatosivorans]TFB51753.1 glycosyltransferase [Cryobacterium tagatosivorans]
MKIAVLHGSNDSYGATRVLIQEVECLVRLGHDVSVFVPHDGPLADSLAHLGHWAVVTIDPGLAVLRRSRLADALRLPSLRPGVADADFVIVWTLALAAYVPALRLRKLPFYVSVHELLPGPVGGILVRGLLAGGRFPVSACSEATAGWLAGAGVDRRRVTVMSPVFSPVAELPAHEPHEPLVIGVVGRVNGHKGHLEVARAFASPALRDRDWKLLLYGAPFPGQEDALDAVRDAIAHDDRITYLGEAPSMAALAGTIDAVACFPSKPEPFGLVPVEAWRLGIRSAGYADGGAAEVLPLVGGIGVPRTIDPVADISAALCAVASATRERAALPEPAAVNPVFDLDRRMRMVADVIARASDARTPSR